jgi:hypothetical protein
VVVVSEQHPLFADCGANLQPDTVVTDARLCGFVLGFRVRGRNASGRWVVALADSAGRELKPEWLLDLGASHPVLDGVIARQGAREKA